MTEIFPREIGIVISNHKLAQEVFEKGMGLTLKHENPTSRIYMLNDKIRLNVWTDGKKHPLFAQEHVQMYADEQTILSTAKALKEWTKDMRFKRSKDNEGQPYLVLSINLPEGSHLSLSNQNWNAEDVTSN